MKYWFYLEPYTFLFRNEKKAVVYNTLNGAYIICPQHPVMEEILNHWEDAANGYGTFLDETILKEDKTISQFVDDIRETFSGDCVEHEEGTMTPYLFKPTLFLNSEIRIKEEKEKTSLGEHVLQNLNEVTLYLSGTCPKQCRQCNIYHHQMKHCTCFNQGKLQQEDYERLLHLFQLVGVQQVNFSAGGNPAENDCCLHYLDMFANAAFKKHLWMDYDFFNEQYLRLAKETHAVLDIFVHPDKWNEQLIANMKKGTDKQLCWHFIVSDELEIETLETLDIPADAHVNIQPFYTGKNLDFFRKYVFIGMEDILAEPVSRKSIFRHKALNDNFFGKITIIPSGDVFSNINCPPIGNITQSSLKELIYKELTEQRIWLKTRNEIEPCRHCINKDLCPSISNYELVLNKHDLCHIE